METYGRVSEWDVDEGMPKETPRNPVYANQETHCLKKLVPSALVVSKVVQEQIGALPVSALKAILLCSVLKRRIAPHPFQRGNKKILLQTPVGSQQGWIGIPGSLGDP